MIRTNKLRGQELRERLVELSQPPRYDSRMKVQNAIHKSLEDMGDDDEDIDLEEILHEMGYYEEEDDDIEEFVGEGVEVAEEMETSGANAGYAMYVPFVVASGVHVLGMIAAGMA